MIAPTIAHCGWATTPFQPVVTQDDEAKSLSDEESPQDTSSDGEAGWERLNSQEENGHLHEDRKSVPLGLGGWLPGWMAALADIIH